MKPLGPRARRLIGGFGALLLLEVLCRVWLAYTVGAGKWLEPDPRRLWRLGPPLDGSDQYLVDSDGFRATKLPGPADAPLILTLGDSSIFGHGVHDGVTIHESLGIALAADGAPARVRTLAVPGYSTLQTRVVMDELGWALKPKVIVIGSLWSDSTLDIVRDADLFRQYHSTSARIEITLSKLALFRVVKRTFNAARGKPAERVISWPQPGDTGVRRVPLPDYAANLEALVEQAREHDVGVVFLGLCNKTMVERGRQTTDPVYLYSDAQYRIAEAHNIPYVDALRVFTATGSRYSGMFMDDLHPSDDGAIQLGRALAGSLESVGWPRRVPVPIEAPAINVSLDTWDGTKPADHTSVAGSLATGEL